MNKLFSKVIGASLAIAMMIGVGVGVNANKVAKPVDATNEVVYKSATFSSSTMGSGVQNYTSTWTNTTTGDTGIAVSLTNFNNNNKGWNYVKTGNKNSASVGKITTNAAIDKAITKVNITIDAITASNVNSIKLYTSSNNSTWTEAGSYDKATGDKSAAISSPTENLYYKLEFDCKKGSGNGLVTVSKVDYYYDKPVDPSKTIQVDSVTIKSDSTTISGTYEPDSPYYIGDTLDLTDSVVAYADGPEYEEGQGDINWSSSNTDVATVEDGIVTFVSAGTTTITATAVDKGESDSVVSASFVLDIRNVGPAYGAEENPYTVAKAKAAIVAGTNVNNVYVTGIVSKIVSAYNPSTGTISYNISDNGANSNVLQAYKGKGINGDDFSSSDDIRVGAVVVIFGNLIKYNTTDELAEGNQLVSYVKPCNITFNTVGGNQIDAQTVLQGQKVQRPDDPTKTATEDYSYSFLGWYDNSEYTGDEYDFNKPVNDDLTLYAKWNEIPAPAKDVVGRMTTATQLSYHYKKTGNGARDYLNKAFTGVSSTSSYSNWNNKTGASGAIYAGNSCGDHDSIQLRATKPSGIITTTSGGAAKIIKIAWNSNTNSSRTIDIYGKDTAYESTDDLYDANKQGTKIDTLGTNDSVLNITDDYAYIGIRSTTGALYLDSIVIQWGELSYDYSDISIRFGGSVTKDLWNRLDSESTIAGVGVMITGYEEQQRSPYSIKDHAAEAVPSTEEHNINTQVVDYYVALSSLQAMPEKNNEYYWNLKYSIDSIDDMLDAYTAAAYIKLTNGELVFLKQVKYSVWSLAKDYLDNRNCDEETAGGSLYNLVNNMGLE